MRTRRSTPTGGVCSRAPRCPGSTAFATYVGTFLPPGHTDELRSRLCDPSEELPGPSARCRFSWGTPRRHGDRLTAWGKLAPRLLVWTKGLTGPRAPEPSRDAGATLVPSPGVVPSGLPPLQKAPPCPPRWPRRTGPAARVRRCHSERLQP